MRAKSVRAVVTALAIGLGAQATLAEQAGGAPKPTLVSTSSSAGAVLANRGPSDVESIETSILTHVNAERRAKGLPALVASPTLGELARSYSRRMVESNFFDHKDPEGNLIRTRVEHSGIVDWINVGENIARNRGFRDPADTAVKEWMKSEGHRINILDGAYRETGIGVWIGPDKTVYVTQIFLTRKPS